MLKDPAATGTGAGTEVQLARPTQGAAIPIIETVPERTWIWSDLHLADRSVLLVWRPKTAGNGRERQRTATDGCPLADEGQRSPAAVNRRTICTGVQSSACRPANPAQITAARSLTAGPPLSAPLAVAARLAARAVPCHRARPLPTGPSPS